ncbi:hypothetical protein PRZ48_001915 [Zasmidium cellare]|uniref:Uncharacterized protein n=1 Tax=Zasmidium cellare TaxID=395010 RepID=A0ABR0F3A1_ZASCE|nr:hypothetical protein PRZ48_001915 [Zasmidium cellare]
MPETPFGHPCPSASNEMADFQLDDLPTYQIWRSAPLDDSFDLTAGLNFYPPKGSPELDEALKFWFPLSQSPQERRRDAVIAFLSEENSDPSAGRGVSSSATQVDEGARFVTSSNASPQARWLESNRAPASMTDETDYPMDEYTKDSIDSPYIYPLPLTFQQHTTSEPAILLSLYQK